MSDALGSEDGAGLRKWASRCTTVALIVFNTLVLFLVINILLWVTFKIRDRSRGISNPEDEYSSEKLAAVYPEFTVDERKALLQEIWSRPYIYEDFIQFKERPSKGTYVNVAAAGFRHSKNQCPWPPESDNLNIFVFGGSTTFGYGVADWQTVPSYFQEHLSRRLQGKRVCVYNFGVGYFFFAQERVFFEKLLAEGAKPHIAMFINGINECGALKGKPYSRERFQRAFEETSPSNSVTVIWERTPMGRAGKFVKRVISREKSERMKADYIPHTEAEVARIVTDYLANKQLAEAVCRQLGIISIFVWQPNPHYKYDLQYHLFRKPDDSWPPVDAFVRLKNLDDSGHLGSNFLWCADLQKDEKECLYVDGIHYTAKFSSKLAETISAMCFERGLIAEADRR